MKKMTLVVSTLALAMAAGSASAATASSASNGPSAGNFGLNVDLTKPTTQFGTPADFLINGRYFITKDMAILAGFGLQMVDSGATTSSKSTNIGLMGGFRKYLKTDDLAPFVGGKLQYLGTRAGTGATAADVTDLSILAEIGAEYYLAKQFSLEGSVGAGYASQESKAVVGGGSSKMTGFGSVTYNLSANFYF